MDNSNLLMENASKDLPQENILPNPELSEQLMIDYYQCPPEFVRMGVYGNLSERPGFFKFGSESVCYGRISAFTPSTEPGRSLNDALEYAIASRNGVALPFDIAETVAALRSETYMKNESEAGGSSLLKRLQHAAYYAVRPLLPVSVRKYFQRYALRNWDTRDFPRWPVDTTVESTMKTAMRLNLEGKGLKEIPFIWFWPDGAQACAVMTHDVETRAGRDFCGVLMDINDLYGLKASFQVIPESRYEIPEAFLENIRRRGSEVNVHDLNHDGKLFKEYEEFSRRAARIEEYRKMFGARGFRAGVLYRNVDWFHLLHFEYDMSVPNVAHLDPQHGGCCTTFPYFIGNMLEIPVTMTQDYFLFNILPKPTMDLWEEQMSLILNQHGVMNFIVHPDYIRSEPQQKLYRTLLARLAELRKTAGLWTPLPGDLNEWWRQRSRMKLVRKGDGWQIEGDGKVRARIAYARLENDALVYSF